MSSSIALGMVGVEKLLGSFPTLVHLELNYLESQKFH
jgi:hypothetical protein